MSQVFIADCKLFPSLTMRTLRTGSYAPGRVVYDLPLYDTLYISLCRGHSVIINSNHSARSATINKPKVADKG